MTTAATVETQQIGGEAMDGWMLILAILGIVVSLVIGGIAAYYARRSVILTEQGMAVQDRQLQLQEEQATMIPRLEVSGIRFLRPEDSPEVQETRREMEEKRREDEQERAEEEERKRKFVEWEQKQEEEQRNNPYSLRQRNPYEDLEILPMFDADTVSDYSDPVRSSRRNYGGPMPNAVLDFQIANKGKAAARDISGTLNLDAAYLRPLDFPGMDDRGISGPDEGFFRVDLVRVPELTGHTAEYRIALQAKHPGGNNKVWIKYEFITPDGIINLKNEKAVELIPGSPR